MTRTTTGPARRSWRAGAGVLLLTVAAAGCGSDGTSEPADQAAVDTTEADPAAFCEAAVELGTALRGELVVGLNTATSPAQAQATLDQFRDSVLPLLASVEETAPAEISGDVSTLTDEIQRAFGTRDPSALQSEDFMAADGAVDEYMLGQCGYQQLEVTGVNYEYEGLPDTLPAEVVAVTFRNEGDELHEVGFVRIDDDVTEPVEQVLATPLDQLFTKLDVTGLAIALPGAADTVFFEFTPGRYGAACFIPQGTTHETVGTGPPHFTLGMFGELTVG